MTSVAGTRFQAIRRWQALAIVLLTFGLMLGSLNFVMPTKTVQPVLVRDVKTPSKVVIDRNPDLVLYRAINARMDTGEGYYHAAAAEQRTQGYPLRPFVTFRLPTLALMQHYFGSAAMTGLIWALIIAVTLAWWGRLKGAFADPGRRVIGVMLIISGLTLAARPELVVVHDNWAGLLVSLSLAIYRPGKALPSIVIALAAVLIREIALPYMLLMAAFAVGHQRWRELLGWAIAVALFTVAMVLHAHAVAGVLLPSDPASQGWAVIGGWPFFDLAMRLCTALRALPVSMGAALVPLAILGWAAWASDTGLRGLLLIAGYMLILMVIGRPENFYWGLIIAPAFLLGFAFMPLAVADLWTALRRADT